MRLFLGCPLPGPAAEALAQWTATTFSSEDVRYVPSGNLHITVAFFGEVEEAECERLKLLTSQVAWHAPVVTTGVVRVLGRGALALRTHGLFGRAMSDQLVALWKRQPDREKWRDPAPHVTLARVRHSAGVPALTQPPPMEFALDRLVLYQSLLSSEGSTYNELAQAARAPSP